MEGIITIDELVKFYKAHQNITSFSSHDNNEKPIHVLTDGMVSFEATAKKGLTEVELTACHTMRNLNNSYISKETMASALPSIGDRPILGYIHKVDGEFEFYGHNVHLNEKEDFVYDEISVGHIPSNPDVKMIYDEDKEVDRVVVHGLLYDEYTAAVEIISRHGECPVSVELCVDECHFDAENDVLVITDFYFSGITILGYDANGNEIKPGMEGSKIKIVNSLENSSVLTEDFNKNSVRKEDKIVEDNKMEKDAKEPTYQVTFELSHDDVRCKIYEQLRKNEDYSGYDYIIDVFDEYFFYQHNAVDEDGTRVSNVFKQNYTKDDNDIQLEGEAIEVFFEYLTKEELTALKTMREDYDTVVIKLKNYERKELNAKRDAILSDSAYGEITESDDFKNLVNNKENYSVDELRKECDLMLGQMRRTFSVSQQPENKNEVKTGVETHTFAFGTPAQEDNSFLDELLNKK